MTNEFILLHTEHGSFWYRASAIVSIDVPLKHEGAAWAKCVINTQMTPRFVIETPKQVLQLILELDLNKPEKEYKGE